MQKSKAPRSSIKRLKHLIVLTLLSLFSLVCQSQTQTEAELEALRQVFLDGQQAASRRQIRTAQSLLEQLETADYALAPYLEMSILIQDANNRDHSEIEAFLQEYQGFWLEEKLRLNWLNTLKSERDYQAYVDHFVPGTGNTVQQCFYLQALYRLDRFDEAYAGAKTMWLVGESQHDDCDYIFDRWRRSDQFTEEYIWQRYILARREGEVRFSNYLAGLVRDDDIELRIKGYEAIRSSPEILENVEQFVQGGIGYSPVISQGLKNLSTKDMDLSLNLWQAYQSENALTPEDLNYLAEGLVDELIDTDEKEKLYQFALANRYNLSDSIFEQGALLALESLDWHRLLDWLDLMSNQMQSENQWTYWRARARNQIGLSGSDYYNLLTEQRDYYGFLASMLEDKPFSLNNEPPLATPLEEISQAQLNAWQRAVELEHVEYFNNSRLTWYHANNELDDMQLTAAANWTAAQDLYYLSIQATIQAQTWNYLSLRFPLAYLEDYKASAAVNNLSLSWIYALSRQESSFARSITSSAGAKGLMQLMPATAREAAQEVGIRYSEDRLSEAQYNIELGTNFLARAYERLDENPVYTSAAYNAGVSRVLGWLRNGRDQLPLDVWIELIPFRETKGYVKNLMAFSVIYADKLGEISPLEELDADMFLPPTP